MPFLRMQESQVYYYNSNRSLPNKTAEFRGFLQPENSVGNVATKHRSRQLNFFIGNNFIALIFNHFFVATNLNAFDSHSRSAANTVAQRCDTKFAIIFV